MLVWLILLVPSALVGLLCALYLKSNWAIYIAGSIPPSVFTLILLYSVYFDPYPGSDATMWPIALIFGGGVAATCSILTFKLILYLKS